MTVVFKVHTESTPNVTITFSKEQILSFCVEDMKKMVFQNHQIKPKVED